MNAHAGGNGGRGKLHGNGMETWRAVSDFLLVVQGGEKAVHELLDCHHC